MHTVLHIVHSSVQVLILRTVHSFRQGAQLDKTTLGSQSTQSAGPVRFLIFCSISISLLASLVAGRRPQCHAGAV
jgi:hypothetical protein